MSSSSPEETPEPSPEQLAEKASAPQEEVEIDRHYVLELGDRIIIEHNKGFSVGTVYYRSNDLLRLKLDNTSSVIEDYPRIYREGEDDRFDEELGVTASYILEKRKTPDFVTQQDFRVGQLLQAFDKDKGDQGTFLVTNVSIPDDSITIVNKADEGDERVLNFNFTGIPLEEPFVILWRKGVEKAVQKVEVPGVTEAPPEGEEQQAQPVKERDEEEDEDVDVEDEFEIRFVGDIVLPQSEVYEEEQMLRKVIPDDIQKSDAINDFLNMLDPALQKDPKALRERRILVETYHLMKQAIIQYNSDGTVYGAKSTSPSTFTDLLRQTRVPMSVPIFDIKKRIFKDPAELGILAEGGITIGDSNAIFTRDDVADIDSYNNQVTNMVSSQISTQGLASKIIKHYELQQEQYEEYERPWRPSKTEGLSFRIFEDMQIIRKMKPRLYRATLPGYNANPVPRENGREPAYPIFGNIMMGLERAFTTTYRKGKGGNQVLLPEEDAVLNGTLIFPPQVAVHLGSTRSGLLALDVARSLEPAANLHELLEDLGGVPVNATIDDILFLKAEGESLTAVSLGDYVEGMDIQALGLGDTLIPLEDYGLSRMEFSTEMMGVLGEKITAHQKQLITALSVLRTQNEEVIEPQANPIISLESPIFDVTSEPTLVEAKTRFENQNPVLKQSDEALTAYFMANYGDYYQSVIGRQPELVAKERNDDIKQSYIRSRLFEQRLAARKADAGEAPKPNRCEHVAKLNAIRKVRDNYDQFYLLSKFLAKYQGARKEGNWIGCKVCHENLLCVHERLQIKAFLNPKEKELVDKELKLNFSGGLFQGSYICRSCGQPMEDLGYDTNLQFDDNGRPMVGRAVLEDKEKLATNDIEFILGMPLKTEDDMKFKTPEATKMYKVLKTLAERVGIFMPKDRYPILIKQLDSYIKTYLPNVVEFNLREQDKKAERKKQGKTYTPQPYYPLLAKYTICAAAALVLIEIQTHIPSYTVHHTLRGCEAGFGGYPLSENTADLQGLRYMVCAILSVPLAEEPWSQARLSEGIAAAEKRESRIEILVKLMVDNCIPDLLTNLKLQEQIRKRQRYNEEKEGLEAVEYAKRPRDIVPATFLPELMSPDILKEGALIPEATASDREKARAWIHMANRISRRFSKPVKGSFIADITCCRANVQTPDTFWANQADLPRFGPRTIRPIIRAPAQQVHFTPRAREAIVAEIPPEITFRLFLKVCFTGPRVGYPHEPGLTNICSWCGLAFGQHPSDLNISEKGKEIVDSAGADTSMKSFEALLDKVHENNYVEPHTVTDQVTWASTLEEFITMSPQPMDDWDETLRTMIEELNKLSPGEGGGLNKGEILEKVADLSELAGAAKSLVMDEITEDKFKNPGEIKRILQEIAGLEWHNFCQVLETYFIKPCKNILNNYDVARLKSYKNKKFAPLHMEHISKMLDMDSKVAAMFSAALQRPENQFGHKKLEYFVKQISAITRFKNMIRPSYFVGRAISFRYIQEALFYGPIQMLFDSSVIPPDYTGPEKEETKEEEEEDSLSISSTVADSSLNLAIQIIGTTVQIFKKYQMNYDDKQIKEYLQGAAEKEKQELLSEFNGPGVTDEQKQLLKLQMSLGMGRFARGALNRVIKYHAEQYEIEKAGIEEMSGQDIDVIYDMEGEAGEEGERLDQGYGGAVEDGGNQDLGAFADE